MSDGSSSSKKDHDLLARLNALRKSPIDLDDKSYNPPVSTQKYAEQIDPAPAKALHADLLSRFRTLKGQGTSTSSSDVFNIRNSDDSENLGLDEDSKTVEQLLAELGPDDSWKLEKDEQTEINDLLESAKSTLAASGKEGHETAVEPSHAEFASIDVEASPGVGLTSTTEVADEDEEVDQPRKSKAELEADIDKEADDIIARLREELNNPPPYAEVDPGNHEGTVTNEQDDNEDDDDDDNPRPALDLPDISHLPPPPSQITNNNNQKANKDDLATRFAALSLPTPSSSSTTPPTQSTTLSLPSVPKSSSTSTTKPATTKTSYTDAEIDTWCTICLEDATLCCLGCDEDLYCTKCWLEGHKGPDAGFEERTHKAVNFNKGGGIEKQEKKKVGRGRVMLGA